MRKTAFWLSLLLALCVIAGCAAAEGVAVKKLTPADKSVTAYVGRTTEPLKIKITPANASDQTLTWASENAQIAEVNDEGAVTGVAVGKTVVTATAEGGKSCKITVTVLQGAEAITLDPSELSVAKGKKVKVTAKVSPAGAAKTKIRWTSSDPKVAVVRDGTVTGKKGGSAVITAETEDGGASAEIGVTVVEPVTSVKVKKSKLTLTEGDETVIEAVVLPSSAGNQKLTWASSNQKVATVSDDGTVSAVGPGKATITAASTDGTKKSAKVQVTVGTINVATIRKIDFYRGNYNPTIKNNGTKTITGVQMWFTSYKRDGEVIYSGLYDFDDMKLKPGKSTDAFYAPVLNRSSIAYIEARVSMVTFADGSTKTIPFDRAKVTTYGTKPKTLANAGTSTGAGTAVNTAEAAEQTAEERAAADAAEEAGQTADERAAAEAKAAKEAKAADEKAAAGQTEEERVAAQMAADAGLAGAGSAGDSFVGTWKGSGATLELAQDGSGRLTVAGSTYLLTWTANGSTLSLKQPNNANASVIKGTLSGDTLTLTIAQAQLKLKR